MRLMKSSEVLLANLSNRSSSSSNTFSEVRQGEDKRKERTKDDDIASKDECKIEKEVGRENELKREE